MNWVRKNKLQMQLLGPRLGGSCNPPHKWFNHVVNDAFSTRFDDGFGWASACGIWGKEGLVHEKALKIQDEIKSETDNK